MTWIYLLQNKSDYLSNIISFNNYVSNHFQTAVKTIRSDNALEFGDKSCKAYFAKHGIVHQTSCVYRPQQNARVERKHKQLLEVARALRFQAGLSASYWGDCVLTTAHLINRLPSSVIDNKIP